MIGSPMIDSPIQATHESRLPIRFGLNSERSQQVARGFPQKTEHSPRCRCIRIASSQSSISGLVAPRLPRVGRGCAQPIRPLVSRIGLAHCPSSNLSRLGGLGFNLPLYWWANRKGASRPEPLSLRTGACPPHKAVGIPLSSQISDSDYEPRSRSRRPEKSVAAGGQRA